MEILTSTKKGKKKSTVSELRGVKQAGNIVVFSVYSPNAADVQLAGDFNNWQPEQTPMKKAKQKGYWEIRLPLPQGRYCYRFVIDGKWQPDPSNSNTEPNQYGELNSVMLVE